MFSITALGSIYSKMAHQIGWLANLSGDRPSFILYLFEFLASISFSGCGAAFVHLLHKVEIETKDKAV